jgi:hypothetical protein
MVPRLLHDPFASAGMARHSVPIREPGMAPFRLAMRPWHATPEFGTSGQRSERKAYDGTLRPHKNPAGYQCYGTYGTNVRTKY